VRIPTRGFERKFNGLKCADLHRYFSVVLEQWNCSDFYFICVCVSSKIGGHDFFGYR